MVRHQDDHAHEAVGAAVERVDARTGAVTEVGVQRVVRERPIGESGHRLHGRHVHVLPFTGFIPPVERCVNGNAGIKPQQCLQDVFGATNLV